MRTRSWPSGRPTVVPGTGLPQPCGVLAACAHRALPVMQQVRDEARRCKVDLIVLPTAEAIGVLTGAAADTNAILR